MRTYGLRVYMQIFAREPLPGGAINFLVIGRLLTEKGVAEFCEASRALCGDYSDACFIDIGPHDPKQPHTCADRDLQDTVAEPEKQSA
ncbi:hypothetical protein DU490_03220 [Halomonas sp. DQ26W]|nr:hypothetical protein DU490_03220 [Halomonas sp. DQ26W]